MMFVTGVVTHMAVLMVLLGPVTFVTGLELQGVLGQSITLPCKYSVRDNGKTEMCWGRGQCPVIGCSDKLIITNGNTITEIKSTKYHIDSKIEEGDVSLTVDHLRAEDSGWYCCRVEISGLFNDQKNNFNLLVLEGSSTPPPSISGVPFTTDRSNFITSNGTKAYTLLEISAGSAGIAGNVKSNFTTSPDETSSFSQENNQNSSTMIGVLAGVGLALLTCLTAIATFIFSKKLKKFNKDDRNESEGFVWTFMALVSCVNKAV
ncbi:hepatitis A virus cellular receptor 1 homolog isoform X3 [Heterodontus francisci]|uniref:hepatitis A virus cellular receptor 1 homolog isoform X3 n=1 Tax=Heterodontus francisci TaxID=7792 RepID=UPI00355B4A99